MELEGSCALWRREARSYGAGRLEDRARGRRVTRAMDPPASLEPHCRICLGPATEGRPLAPVGCKCTGSVALAHQECALRWFWRRAMGRAEGLARDERWKVTWWVLCEICNSEVSQALVEGSLGVCKAALSAPRGLQDKAAEHAARAHVADATRSRVATEMAPRAAVAQLPSVTVDAEQVSPPGPTPAEPQPAQPPAQLHTQTRAQRRGIVECLRSSFRAATQQ